MQLVGKDWHVKFFRRKKQYQYHWKDNPEYDTHLYYIVMPSDEVHAYVSCI